MGKEGEEKTKEKKAERTRDSSICCKSSIHFITTYVLLHPKTLQFSCLLFAFKH